MIIKVKAKFVNEDVELVFGKYFDGTTAIKGQSVNGEPLFTVTVLVDVKPADGCVFLKGWSENAGISQALCDAGVLELTGRTVKTGFCKAFEAKLLRTE
tara:strand:- start:179 stop:475 length:297 start_codon:yes stop_codon:yes gene_type:complete